MAPPAARAPTPRGTAPLAIAPALEASSTSTRRAFQARRRQITSNLNSGEDELDFTDQNGITGTYDSGTGVLTLTGTSSVANYQAALRSVTYENSSDDPSTATRTVSFQDDRQLVRSDSNVATRDISVAR